MINSVFNVLTFLEAMLNPAVWKLNPDESITQALLFDVFRPGTLFLKAGCKMGAEACREVPFPIQSFYSTEIKLFTFVYYTIFPVVLHKVVEVSRKASRRPKESVCVN